MFSLLTVLVSTIGPAGLGSILKMFAGWLDSRAARAERREERKYAQQLALQKEAIRFQESVLNDPYSRATRRLLGVIGMLALATISILCTLYPSAPLLTFIPPEHKSDISLLWGIVSFPVTRDMVTTITTGHLALMSVMIYSMIVGFYFTPGGRK